MLIYPVGHIRAPLIKQHLISAAEPREAEHFRAYSTVKNENNKYEKPSALYCDVLRMCTARSDEEKKKESMLLDVTLLIVFVILIPQKKVKGFVNICMVWKE